MTETWLLSISISLLKNNSPVNSNSLLELIGLPFLLLSTTRLRLLNVKTELLCTGGDAFTSVKVSICSTLLLNCGE